MKLLVTLCFLFSFNSCADDKELLPMGKVTRVYKAGESYLNDFQKVCIANKPKVCYCTVNWDKVIPCEFFDSLETKERGL